MSVLTKPEILKLIDSGVVIIDPFDPQNIGPASIDFHLSDLFRVFKPAKETVVIDEHFDFKTHTRLLTQPQGLTLKPGQSAHGITIESLTLPNNLCGWIQGKSSLARIGLMVHITANFIHPGFSGKQVLEMTNAGPMALTVKPHIPICQIILEETKGQAQYQGKYYRQTTP